MPPERPDAEGLIRDADAAMYAAKRAGRARCAVFDEALRAQVSLRFQLEAQLRASIEADGLDVHFQPIVSLQDGRTTGLEALCRWQQVSPADFIPIAEESGLILPLGEQVLAQAARRSRGDPSSRAGVSQRCGWASTCPLESSTSPTTPDARSRSSERAAFPPTTSCSSSPSPSSSTPATKSTPPCAPSATPASSSRSTTSGAATPRSTYLRRYPLDVLKLDISYTQAMVHDAETRVIVETLVGMALRLGLSVVAEGVETQEQLDLAQRARDHLGPGLPRRSPDADGPAPGDRACAPATAIIPRD